MDTKRRSAAVLTSAIGIVLGACARSRVQRDDLLSARELDEMASLHEKVWARRVPLLPDPNEATG